MDKKNQDEQKIIDKATKIEEEKKDLLNKVLSGNITTTREKVGFILNHHSDARNSDIALAWKYWTIYESDLFDGNVVTRENLMKLKRIVTLCRDRARIQNDYKLFQADDKVKQQRGVLEDEFKQKAIDEQPVNLPIYSVYMDETGKTGNFLAVGSIWVVDGMSTLYNQMKIRQWKESKDINYEFHFSELSKGKLPIYKEFFLKFLKLNPTIAFKAIIVSKQGLKTIGTAITDLTFHLINKGIKQEHDSNRSPLPRRLQVWLDQEEPGSDQMKIENLKERLTAQKIEGLRIGDFQAVDSKDNFYIQAVDLFTAAINRKLHSENNNFKDELADYIFSLLDFDIDSIQQNNSDSDRSTVFDLSYNSRD